MDAGGSSVAATGQGSAVVLARDLAFYVEKDKPVF